MKIITVIENSEGKAGCVAAHGLSFYIETKKHKILMDMGPSDLSLDNAKVLGIDLAKVDTAVLSHGHYDHSGGLMSFAKLNEKAIIYMQDSAGKEYYANDGTDESPIYKYIGIDKKISELPNLKMISGDYTIDDEAELFTINKRTHPLPFSNKRILIKKDEKYKQDNFEHEHYLRICSEGKTVLISGCAHNGILSIMDSYRQKYGDDPDFVISGFHLMKATPYNEMQRKEVENIAKELKGYKSKFYTGHCTGAEGFEILKSIMGTQIEALHTGMILEF